MGFLSHLFLEQRALFRGHRVGLGYDRDNVDLVMQALHEFHVQGFEAVTGRRDEVQACVHACVRAVRA